MSRVSAATVNWADRSSASMFRDIAQSITLAYHDGAFYRETHHDDGRERVYPLAIFRIGSLCISCKDTPEAVAVVVAKYRRGIKPICTSHQKKGAWPARS